MSLKILLTGKARTLHVSIGYDNSGETLSGYQALPVSVDTRLPIFDLAEPWPWAARRDRCDLRPRLPDSGYTRTLATRQRRPGAAPAT